MTPLPETTFELRSGLLFVTSSGIFHINWFIELIAQITVKAKEMNAAGVLLDVRSMTGTVTYVDRYRAGYTAANTLMVIPAAVVGSEPLIDPNRLGEMVARNRGVNVKVFTEYAEAEQWLINNSIRS